MTMILSPKIQLDQDDPLPRQICEFCFKRFCEWDFFRSIVLESDRQLRASLRDKLPVLNEEDDLEFLYVDDEEDLAKDVTTCVVVTEEESVESECKKEENKDESVQFMTEKKVTVSVSTKVETKVEPVEVKREQLSVKPRPVTAPTLTVSKDREKPKITIPPPSKDVKSTGSDRSRNTTHRPPRKAIRISPPPQPPRRSRPSKSARPSRMERRRRPSLDSDPSHPRSNRNPTRHEPNYNFWCRECGFLEDAHESRSTHYHSHRIHNRLNYHNEMEQEHVYYEDMEGQARPPRRDSRTYFNFFI